VSRVSFRSRSNESAMIEPLSRDETYLDVTENLARIGF
jgi:hypothetical protein